MKYPILVPNIFNHPFTYESNIKLKVGDYVLVPFGKVQLTGVVWNEFEKKNNKNFKIKKVIKIGLAFSFQKISSIPTNQYDKRLDFIVTEKEILR